ncbi:hypothetical protein BC834DRAFT_868366 [Gloeopeniophorella convolvens]|nr:hypothetical protein BC834DRAFT_868366 [Gloeopeniophorella convolvens]
MSSFSRLQLAAALIEYDNDPADPEKPFRSAHDSAVFAHLRRIPPLPPQPRRSADYLGVDLPSDNGSTPIPESTQGHVRAPSSMDVLRNPFGADGPGSDGILEEENEEELEVDLASWGLDSFMPKEKNRGSKNAKKKEKIDTLPNPHATTQASSYRSVRSMSMGNLDSFGAGGAFLDSVSTAGADMRRRSLGSALDLVDQTPLQRPPLQQRPSSSHEVIDRIPPTPPLHSVPFPSQSVRSASPGPYDGIVGPSRERATSFASMGSRGLLTEAEEKPNPFELEPPPPGQASRFDPKARSRTMSMGTVGSMGSRNILADEASHFSQRAMSPSSRLDPAGAVHNRTFSNASMGSRMLGEDDAASFAGGAPGQRPPLRNRPYSTVELMRPKVLVMPSPLQGQSAPVPKGKSATREGFEFSVDGPPLPHGARTGSSRRLSSAGLLSPTPGSAVPVASNSFTPNPRASLTLSQLTFRNTLMVGGQRDVSYADIDGNLRRATEEGEQIVEEVPEEEPAHPVAIVVDEPEEKRAPGKLYGRSLVDELELRKATMRSKQRVFTGDDRPSMMARGPMKRSSTFIDPASLTQRVGPRDPMGTSDTRPNLTRSGSFGGKPLLNFDEERSPGLQAPPNATHNARSVFGVDTLWEREMAKLKEIEAREAEDKRQQEAAEAERLRKKAGKKKKGKEKEIPPEVPTPEEEQPRVSAEPPVLPVIPRGITKGAPPPPNDDDSESSSGMSEAEPAQASEAPRKSGETSGEGWYSGESDRERAGPVRTTGVGPRYPNRSRGRTSGSQHLSQTVGDDDSSEEDMPLAATVSRAMQRATRLGPATAQDSDSDEEKPLSQLLAKAAPGIPPVDSGELRSTETRGLAAANDEDEDEDDQPLGLRASRFVPRAGNADDDDDRPLAFHPEQQRRTQYSMLLQQQQQQLQLQQQQQQQMILQAQMQQSMMFSPPSLMGSAFFSTPMLPQMVPMIPPIPASPPPGAPDTAKFGRVDRWRREIVEGQP